ncbi:portal protein [Thermoanaerobacterium phage THSA-485A]|uniref:portal protein n=1 Tax=Thermoanaerobacterium phage THSA-485A TaxID=1126885 RepID=UPI000263F846|nr:portal protein [Thermoanaerobacterium phage THSA-485A]AFK87714.1 hypothetical protein Tsac_2861 [Thermoanaerobacterium phage THSA-485A]
MEGEKRTDLSQFAKGITDAQNYNPEQATGQAQPSEGEKPMDNTIHQTVQDPTQWFGPNKNGTFGPLSPPQPFPLQGEPRQWQYRPAWNIPSPPSSTREVDAELLRKLADSYDLLRRCIEIRKYEMCSLDWDIVPREKNNKRAKEISDANADVIQEIKQVFMYPEAFIDDDGHRKPIHTFQEWLSALLEDYFVLDAMTIYPRPTKGGKLLALERVDGSTIKPLLTIDGRVPIPPAPAYQQYLYGMPRASFTLKQLYYKPRNVRNHSPYGFSHVEQALIHINFALKVQMWYTAYFTQGSIPEGLLEMPEGWTPDQMWQFIDEINATMAGNASAKRQLYPVPTGVKWQSLKEFDMNAELINYIVTVTCSLFDIQPIELGFMPLHGSSGLGGKGFGDSQNLVHERKSLIPTAHWLESIFTQIIHDWWGAYDLEFSFTSIRDMEDEKQDESDINLVKNGIKSIDEVVMERGGEPPGIGRMFVNGSTILFEPDMVAGTKYGATALGLIKNGTPLQSLDEAEGDTQKISRGTADLIKALMIKKKAQIEEPNDNETKSDEDQFKKWFVAFLIAYFTKSHKLLATSTLGFTLPVKSIMNYAFSVSDEDIEKLAQSIFKLRKAEYLTAINKQLKKIGLEPTSDITAKEILQALDDISHDRATGILNTLQSDIQGQIEKLSKQGLEGKDLVDELKKWQKEHIEWKAKQVALTEGNDSYIQAFTDFNQKNDLSQYATFYVMPTNAVCETCQELIDNSPYTGDEGMQVLDMIPVHPNCVHHVDVEYDLPDDFDTDDIWTGGE